MKPEIEIYSHVEPDMLPGLSVEQLGGLASRVLADILALPQGSEHVLSGLETVEISLVDDEAIGRVHGEFLDDPEATDVITFPHGDGLGEILVSVETAARQAPLFNELPDKEVFRYIVHGLLHLHGYLDQTDEDRAKMFSFQEPLVERYFPGKRS